MGLSIRNPETEKLARQVSRVHALPVRDERPEDEILGYDENGIPS
jgi:hypothetical protein